MAGPAFPGAMGTGPMPGAVGSGSSDQSIPIVMWCAGGAAVLLVVATLMFMVGRGSSPDPQIAQADAQPAASQDVRPPEPPSAPGLTQLQQTTTSAGTAGTGEPASESSPDEPVQPTASGPISSPQRIESAEDIYKLAKCSVVKIDVFNDTLTPRSAIGSGFIIDTEQRLIVTNYHVVCTAAKADIVFDDGTRFGIEGYVLVEPEMDLAVLKANGLPPYAQALKLGSDADPNPGSEVYSIGHPKDYKLTMRSGLIASVANTTELPEDAQMFLKAEGTSHKDNRWIQHEAEIFGGNSGGPLLNKHGVVLGINTWKDESINGHFALHCKALTQLLNRPMDRVAPLTRYQRGETTDAERLARTLDWDSVRKRLARMEDNNWMPENDEDCEALGTLAMALTVIGMGDFSPNDPNPITGGFIREVYGFRNKMGFDRNWFKTSERIDKINGYAEKALENPTTGQGLMLVLEIKRSIHLPVGGLVRGYIGKRPVIVKILDPRAQPTPGRTWLVPCVVTDTEIVDGEKTTIAVCSSPFYLRRDEDLPEKNPPMTSPPGRSTNPPGRATTPPGRSTTPPRRSTNPPGRSTTPPGRATTPPKPSAMPPSRPAQPSRPMPPSQLSPPKASSSPFN